MNCCSDDCDLSRQRSTHIGYGHHRARSSSTSFYSAIANSALSMSLLIVGDLAIASRLVTVASGMEKSIAACWTVNPALFLLSLRVVKMMYYLLSFNRQSVIHFEHGE